MEEIDQTESPSAADKIRQPRPANPPSPPSDESWASGQRKRYLASLPHQDR